MTLELGSSAALGSPVHLAREISPEIEKNILRFVVDGFERWKEKGLDSFCKQEDPFTVRLVACMKELKRERDIPFVPEYQHVELLESMLEGEESPAYAGISDIEILWDLFVDDASYCIECKRVASGVLARLYVVEGINRFVQGRYASRLRASAMIGYVVQGAPGEVFVHVNHQIGNNQCMDSEHLLYEADPIKWLKTVYESNHPRPSQNSSIRLTHLFFDMR